MFSQKIQKIKCVIFDIDGVFTDGRIFIDNNGIETKAFNVKDGLGVKLLQQAGIHVAIISSRHAPAVSIRMKELGVRDVFLGQAQKLPAYENILHSQHITDENAAYMGDDLPDLPILKRVGFSITVPGAVDEVKAVADFMTKAKAGKGAVREACELILREQGKWDDVIQK